MVRPHFDMQKQAWASVHMAYRYLSFMVSARRKVKVRQRSLDDSDGIRTVRPRVRRSRAHGVSNEITEASPGNATASPGDYPPQSSVATAGRVVVV